MDFFEASAKRHSYRASYRNQPVSKKDLKMIVQAGIQAPSGKNEQTTTFVIVDDPALVAKIRAIPGGNKAVASAQAYIACVIDENPQAVYEGHAFQVEDCAAAAENMLLAITALSYASVWVDGWLRLEGRAHQIGQLLGVPAGKIIRILLPVGIPTQHMKQRDRKPFEQRAWFNTHG